MSSSFNNYSSSNRNEDDKPDTTNPLYQLLERQAGELEAFARRMKSEIRNSHREFMKFQQQQQRIQQTKLDSFELGLVESLKNRIRELESESTVREKKQKSEIQQLKRELNEFKNKFTLLYHTFEQTRTEMLSRNETTSTRGKRNPVGMADRRTQLIEDLRVLSNNMENDDDVESIKDNEEGIITINLDVPHNLRGFIIGKNGNNVKQIERETKTKITMRLNGSAISGTKEGIEMAKKRIDDILDRAHNQQNDSDASNTNQKLGGSGDKGRQKRNKHTKLTTFRFSISPQHAGIIIGKEGKTLNQIRRETNTNIKISSNGDIVVITGTKDKAEMAKKRIEGIIGSVIDKTNNCLESDVESVNGESVLDGDSILDDESILDFESVLDDESGESVLCDEEENIIIKLFVPKHLHGAVIGKGGCHMKQLKNETKTYISMRSNGETTISGKKEGVEKAKKRIEDTIESINNKSRDKKRRPATNNTKLEDEIEDDVESTKSTIDDEEGFEGNFTNDTSKLSMVPTIISHIPTHEFNDDDDDD